MFKSAKCAILAILLTLSSTVSAIHIPRGGINPFMCHLTIKRYEESYCARRFFKDLENKEEKKQGTTLLMNTCQSWDDAPFRGVTYGWQSCTFYQEPWRAELGLCNLTLFSNPSCDGSGHNMVFMDFNSREALSQRYQSGCLGSEGEDAIPYRSASYFCEKPGYVAGY